ncbi:unnamed protein product, partial [marine sediment metagenome]
MKNIALLVMDVQKVYSLNHSRLKVNNVESIVENINKIIRHFENKNLPVIYIRHLHNPDGSDAGRMYDFSGKTSKIGFKKGSLEAEYIDDLIIIKGAPEIIKNRYNSFFNKDLADLLNKLKINQVVIVGFMTNFCCESTAGMTINASSGVISWTPSTVGDYDVTIEVTDGGSFDTQSFTITVAITDVLSPPTGVEASEL